MNQCIHKTKLLMIVICHSLSNHHPTTSLTMLSIFDSHLLTVC